MTTAITDFTQYASLRHGAENNDPAALREVAGQFEALFIQSLMKNMREASLADPIFGKSDSFEMFQEMQDQQFAKEMASGRGIGLAEMIVRQLSPVGAAERGETAIRGSSEGQTLKINPHRHTGSYVDSGRIGSYDRSYNNVPAAAVGAVERSETAIAGSSERQTLKINPHRNSGSYVDSGRIGSHDRSYNTVFSFLSLART